MNAGRRCVGAGYVAPHEAWWPESWLGNHTLRTALANSVVWYYQELARRIGCQRTQSYVHQLAYGNQDISGGIDEFWLVNGLGALTAVCRPSYTLRVYGGGTGGC